MCDFAADADAARQLLVGRVLTVERVRQLNAKDYFYQMLKDNPEMLKIYPGIENELLKGAIDCHIHAYPDFNSRINLEHLRVVFEHLIEIVLRIKLPDPFNRQ